METPAVFVVSDDEAVRDSVRSLVESAGLQAHTYASLPSFLDEVEPGRRGCVVVDVHLGELMDEEWRTELAAAFARMPGLLMTDRGDVPTAVRAIKAGAMEVVEKPSREGALLASIERALAADAAAHG